MFNVKKDIINLLITFALFSLIICGCAVKVPVAYQMPGRIDLSKTKRVAVLDFEGNRNTKKWIPEILAIRIQQTEYFKVIERGEIAQVLKEQKLGMTGLVDPKTASKVGRILGVDAVIFGTVDSWEVKDIQGTDKYPSIKNGKLTMVRVPYIKRRAFVCFTVKVIDSSSAEVIASEILKGEVEDKAFGRDRRTEIKSKDEILLEAAEIGVANFVKEITPNTVYEERILAACGKEGEIGIQYAKKGRWKRAIEVWEKMLEKEPSCSSIHYNLGIAYEATGKLSQAKKEYEEAEKLEPKEEYMDAVNRINKLMQTQEKL